jgi:hypothetical protein
MLYEDLRSELEMLQNDYMENNFNKLCIEKQKLLESINAISEEVYKNC